MVYKKDRWEKFVANLPEYITEYISMDAIYDIWRNARSTKRAIENLVEWADDVHEQYAKNNENEKEVETMVEYVDTLTNVYEEEAHIFKCDFDGFYVRLECSREKINAQNYDHAVRILERMGYRF